MNIETKLLRITPQSAAKFLENVHERQTGRNSENVIALYAKQMEAGQWDEGVMQSISIDSTGALLDGWHRLNAVVRSGVTLPFLVVRGVPPTAFGKYDAHMQRSLGFRMGLHKDRASELSYLVDLAKWPACSGRKINEEIELAQEAFGTTLEFFEMHAVKQKRRNVTVTPVRVACMLNVHRTRNAEMREQIIAAYSMLVAANFKDAPRVITSLHRRLTETGRERHLQFALAFKAFNPRRFEDVKLQINNVGEVIREAQHGPLKDLVGAIHE